MYRAHLARELLDRRDSEVSQVLERYHLAQMMRQVGTVILKVNSEGIYGQTEEA
jgi:hypothetical protein